MHDDSTSGPRANPSSPRATSGKRLAEERQGTRSSRMGSALGVLLVLLAAAGCSEGEGEVRVASTAQPSDGSGRLRLLDRAPCSDRTATRRALFGDLHVHTALSMDAYLFDTRASPADAYRFAQGEEILIAPLDAEGSGTRPQRIDRPLDFAAVTDHAENFGRVARCTRPGSDAYDTKSCATYRGEGRGEPASGFLATVRYVTERSLAIDADEVCGEDGRLCRDAVDDYWGEIQRAAERYYDRSERCAFTTFVAYEYSLSPSLSKVHRNVIFRNEVVLDRPIHALDEPEALVMLRRLRDECNDGIPGCEALAIPHNPNLSDGRMFRAEYPGTMNALQEARFARLRASMEPVVEMMQIKGDSECRNGLVGVGGAVDELCGFEKMRSIATATPPPDCRGEIGAGSLVGRGCVDRNDFVRTALVAGLAEEERIGVNPFEFGFIGSTDAHDGTMGNVAENGAMARGGRGASRISTNPGGLVGVWAEENSRDAIFEALGRRETFATSGPRIEPRFFAGAGLPAALCERNDAIEAAYASGVPMGGELLRAPGEAPRFFVTATRDPGTETMPSNALERIQIVKGWVGEEGVFETRVFDIAGEEIPDEALSTERCEVVDAGRDALCGMWQDPDHDESESAVYYARVVEAPSCRWSTHLCLRTPESERPAFCSDSSVPRSIRERAWTSPIWVRSEKAVVDS